MHRVHLTTFGGISVSHNGVPQCALPPSSVQLLAYLALLRGEPVAPKDVARRLFPQQAYTESLESLREAQEALWKGFPLSVRLFQGISVAEAERLQCGLRVVAVPGIARLDADAFQAESLLTASWSELPRCEAASRLTQAARLMEREFLEGLACGWGLEIGQRLCRLFRSATVAALASELPESSTPPEPTTVESPPSPLGRFFGRRAEREQMAAYLEAGETTLTLVGLGGVGKSRLALEFLRELPPSWRGVPVLCVSLASVVTKVGVLEAILESLGKRVGGAYLKGRDTLITVLQALQEPAVLLLDNVEDATLEPGGEVVQLLSYLRYRCPKLVMICTSRCRVGIPEELVIPVSAFDLPSAEDMDGIEPSELRDRFPGLEMIFDAMDGACKIGEALRGDFARQAELLRATGGLPLAIEMLAARAAVAQRLPTSAEASEGELSPARSIEWALSTLSAEASAVFYAVSLFCDTFTSEAVEGVTGRPNAGFALSELDDVALLHAVPGDGYLRYRIVPSVRTWAREQLASTGALAERKEAHARYFASLLTPETALTPEKLAPLTVWLMDMVRAVEFYLKRGSFVTATATAEVLGQVFDRTGRYDLGVDLLHRLLVSLEAAIDVPKRCFAEVRDCLGRLLVNTKGDDEAIQNLIFALDYWNEQGDTFRVARAANNLGVIFDRNHNFEMAEYYYTQALNGFTQINKNSAVCSLTMNMSSMYIDKGDYLSAKEWIQKSYHIADFILNDDFLRVIRLINIGESDYLLGNYSESNKHFNSALSLIEKSRDSYRLAQLSLLIGMNIFEFHSENQSCLELISSGFNFFDSKRIDIPIADVVILEARKRISSRQVKIPDFDFDDQFFHCKMHLTL